MKKIFMLISFGLLSSCGARFFHGDYGLGMINKSSEDVVLFTIICDDKYVIRDMKIRKNGDSYIFPFFNNENEIKVFVSCEKNGVIKYLDSKRASLSDIPACEYFVISVDEIGYIQFGYR